MTVYGRNSIEEALAENVELTEILVDRDKADRYANLMRNAKEKGVSARFVSESDLAKASRSQKHQGIVATLRLPATVTENAGDEFDYSDYSVVLALDGITDTGNFGAIVRSALLLGAGAVVLPNDNSARITPAAIRASAGAMYRQRILYVNSLNTHIDLLHAAGFAVYALEGRNGVPIESLDIPKKVCLVIGSEREGIRKSVRKRCDETVSIPTTGRLDSLNASVAAAISLWEVFRRAKPR